MTDDLKQFIEEKTKETKRHFDVAAENLEHKIDNVAEQVGANAEKLGEHDSRFDTIESKLNSIDDRSATVETILEAVNLPALKQKVDILEKRLGALEAKF